MAPLVHVDLKAHSLAVMRSAREICTFDLAGRLVSFFDGESHYWRGLSGTVVRKWTDRAGRKQAEPLGAAQAGDILKRAQEMLRDLPHASPEVREVANRALAYDAEADAQRFRQVYGKVGILPPDQYLALVLQVAVGCAWNRCTFCHFYRDQRFHRRDVTEFRRHVEDVLGFLGESRLLRRSVFLGDADVLAAPAGDLASMICIAQDRAGLDDVHAFAEARSVARRGPAELADLAAAGLKRIYIGAESGSDRLLEALQKRSRTPDVIAAVEALKGAGVRVGVIFLAGLGDPEHPAATRRLVERLPLGAGDFVYLSRLWGAPDETADAEMRGLGQGLAFLKARGVKVAPYDIRQFVY